MARTDPQVNFRIPAELLEKLRLASDSNNRTLTAEVVSRLEGSFKTTEAIDPFEFALNPHISRSHGNVAITARWTVVIDEADASKLADMEVTDKPTKLGFNPVDANHVVLTVTPNTQAKALLLDHQALGLKTLLASKPQK